MKKLSLRHLFYLLLSFSITIFSCKKNDIQIIIPDNSNPDLVTKVTSTISGFVTDENDEAMKGATVRVGSAFLNTDQFGYFEIKNVDVNQTAATFSVSKNGYFKLTKTFMAKEGKASFFRLKLTPKTAIGTINATSGGNVSLSNGTIIALPADGVKDASTGAGYSGAITVYAHYIDPTAADIAGIMPGDLRGLRTNGDLNILDSYGMLEVELNGASGELLQMATGKTATLTMAIPASLTATAPATIPLWYFDETTGLWKEEGLANKVGNQYVGEVAHFSTWNCDNPRPHVPYHCRLVYSDGSPASNVEVRLLEENYYGGGTNHGFTDDNGEVFGGAPANARVRMEVGGGLILCGGILYTTEFNTGGQAIDLGEISFSYSPTNARIIGTATDCNNNPLANGKAFIIKNGICDVRPVTNGQYSLTGVLCNTNVSANIFVQNSSDYQQSATNTYSISYGDNNIPNITACGNTIAGSSMVWMDKDLDVVTYRNGDIIPEVKDSLGWRNLTTGAWCWMNGDSAGNAGKYSRLYNWYAVNDPRGLAPQGWHIPNNQEWQAYFNLLGGIAVAGDKMKQAGTSNWLQGNQGTNESGFNGLPTGVKYSDGVSYSGQTVAGYWWSSTDHQSSNTTVFMLWYNHTNVDEYYDYYNKNFGFSVRCLKD